MTETSNEWLVGGGAMRALVREHDWAQTPLGPLPSWPIELRAFTDMAFEVCFPVGVLWGEDQTLIYNDAFVTVVGDRHPAVGMALHDVWPELQSTNDQSLARIAAGETVVLEGLGSNGTDETSFKTSCSPLRDRDGSIKGALLTASPVTDERGKSSQRAGALWETFADTSTDVLWISDPRSGTLDYVSPSFETVWGVGRDTLTEDVSRFQRYVHPEDRKIIADTVRNVMVEGSRVVEYRIVRPRTGEVRWIRDTGFVIPGITPLRLGGIARDITEQHLARARQGRLMFELQDRVRDTLTIMRSLVRRTADHGGTVEDMATHLAGRIDALARTEAALVDDPDVTVDLDSIVREELMAFGIREGSEVSINGDPLALRPSIAQLMTLAVHELATNAVKFGAFSYSRGHLAVRWRLAGEDKPQIVFEWRETGVPITIEPAPSSLGAEFLERSLLRRVAAKVDRELTNDGLRCLIEVPLEPSSRNHNEQFASR